MNSYPLLLKIRVLDKSPITKQLISEELQKCWGILFYFALDACVYAKSLQSCPTLCELMNHSPTGSYVHGILQARILEWVALDTKGQSSILFQLLYLPSFHKVSQGTHARVHTHIHIHTHTHTHTPQTQFYFKWRQKISINMS